MKAINLLIKPASSSCNLNCTYCFYNDVADNRAIKNYGIMNDTTLENMVKKAFEEEKFTNYLSRTAIYIEEVVGIGAYEKFLKENKQP